MRASTGVSRAFYYFRPDRIEVLFSKALAVPYKISCIHIRCAEFNALSDGIRFQSNKSPQTIQEDLRHGQLNILKSTQMITRFGTFTKTTAS